MNIKDLQEILEALDTAKGLSLGSIAKKVSEIEKGNESVKKDLESILIQISEKIKDHAQTSDVTKLSNKLEKEIEKLQKSDSKISKTILSVITDLRSELEDKINDKSFLNEIKSSLEEKATKKELETLKLKTESIEGLEDFVSAKIPDQIDYTNELNDLRNSIKVVDGKIFKVPAGVEIFKDGQNMGRFPSLNFIGGTVTASASRIDVDLGSGGGGASAFTDLTDTPSSYAGQSGKAVVVNGTSDGLEFTALSGGGDMLAATYDPNSVSGDAFDMDNMVEGTTNKILTATERSEIAANTAKVTNATHTGEVTGSVGLTLNVKAIDNRTDTTIATGDYLLFQDITDGLLKKDTVQGILDLFSGISNVVEDLTPQLGGDLDLNGNDITDTGATDINITKTGAGALNISSAGGGLSLTTSSGNGDITINPHGTGKTLLGGATGVSAKATSGVLTLAGLSGTTEDLTINLSSNNLITLGSTTGANLNTALQFTGTHWLLGSTGSSYFGNGTGAQLRTGFGGVTSPTAKVHIGAGTTSASTAPLKLTSGSLMTTPEAGAIEFLTDGLYYTNTSAVRREIANLAGTQTFTNKTLTAPKFADLGYIADANGNEMLVFDSEASAINHFTITNRQFANGPSLKASGDDTNIDILIIPKGSGLIGLTNGVYGTAVASAANINTGTSTSLIVTPDALAGSIFGTKEVIIPVFLYDYVVTTGDGKVYVTLPSTLNGMDLVGVRANLGVAPSTSGTPTIQIARGRRASATSALSFVDVLSTRITVDANKYDSKDATTAAVINTSNDDIATGDVYRIDVDTAGTGTKGLDIICLFRLP